MRVGVIGCGSIGSYVSKWLSEKGELEVVFDKVFDKAFILANELGVKAAKTFSEFLNCNTDMVVECASQEAVFNYTEEILKSGKDILILSVGAFANKEFREKTIKIAEKLGKRVYIPSGAIAGLDGISAVAEYVDEVTLVTRKSPESLGVKNYGVIFEGNAEEAAKMYPRNLNVAAALGLIVGFEKVKVRIVADRVDENIHEITAKGKFGEIRIVVKNVKLNPKTSYLAALSVIKTIKNMENSLVIG